MVEFISDYLEKYGYVLLTEKQLGLYIIGCLVAGILIGMAMGILFGRNK